MCIHVSYIAKGAFVLITATSHKTYTPFSLPLSLNSSRKLRSNVQRRRKSVSELFLICFESMMSHVAESETTLEAGALGGGKKKVRKKVFYFKPFFPNSCYSGRRVHPRLQLYSSKSQRQKCHELGFFCNVKITPSFLYYFLLAIRIPP